VVGALALALVAGCGGDDSSPTTTTTTTGEGGGGKIALHTAPPLEDLMTLVVDAYRAADPRAEVTVVAEDQADLVASVETGEADVAVVPNAWLTDLEGAEPFGRNVVVMAVPAGNPGGIAPEDFAAGGDATVAVCGDQTPLGNFVVGVLANLGVTPDPATVKAGCEGESLQAIADGELDAAFLFRGGQPVPDGVELVEIPEDQNIVIDLSLMRPSGSPAADSLMEFLDSDAVKELLTQYGYLP
jgi:molybdate transport system substrate-binding protein